MTAGVGTAKLRLRRSLKEQAMKKAFVFAIALGFSSAVLAAAKTEQAQLRARVEELTAELDRAVAARTSALAARDQALETSERSLADRNAEYPDRIACRPYAWPQRPHGRGDRIDWPGHGGLCERTVQAGA